MAKMRVRQQDGSVVDINLGKFARGSGDACVVDQTYNSESENAQSGKAVAEAIEAALENVPSGGGSVGGEADIASAVKTTNGQTLRFFVGTHEEYEALENKDGLFAIISDDETKEQLFERIQDLERGVGINEEGIQELGSRFEELYGIHMGDMPGLLEFHENLVNGKQFVAKAEHAIQADSALFATEAEFATMTSYSMAGPMQFDPKTFEFNNNQTYEISFTWSFSHVRFQVHTSVPNNNYTLSILAPIFGYADKNGDLFLRCELRQPDGGGAYKLHVYESSSTSETVEVTNDRATCMDFCYRIIR